MWWAYWEGLMFKEYSRVIASPEFLFVLQQLVSLSQKFFKHPVNEFHRSDRQLLFAAVTSTREVTRGNVGALYCLRMCSGIVIVKFKFLFGSKLTLIKKLFFALNFNL
jgi:hypothetical protein